MIKFEKLKYFIKTEGHFFDFLLQISKEVGAESGRPNNRKPEGQIKNTIRLNWEAEFNRKAKIITIIIPAQY